MALVDDVFSEILERVDPSFIFDCIHVCKGWLEVITSPEFRQRYQKRWKTDSKLVGFLMHGRGYEYKLSACSKLGRIMDGNKSSQLPYDHFISKSGAGDGLILYGSLSQQRLYVSKADEMRAIQLPPLPNPGLYDYFTTAILSQGNSYKVLVLARLYIVTIQTFSSSTGNWEKSEVPLPNGRITGPGMVSSSRGLVYWGLVDFDSFPALVYDANNGSIRRIDQPLGDPLKPIIAQVHYGLSPQGNLLCVLSSLTNLDIWRLDDGDSWNPLHSLDSGFIYQYFASFVPGRLDSIFVLRGFRQEEFCLCNLHTDEVVSCPSGYMSGFYSAGKWWLVPLTMADLGVWPSSPFSNTTETSNIRGIKQLLTW